MMGSLILSTLLSLFSLTGMVLSKPIVSPASEASTSYDAKLGIYTSDSIARGTGTNYASLYFQSDSVTLSTLSFEILYDPTLFTVQSTSTEACPSGTLADVNSDAANGSMAVSCVFPKNIQSSLTVFGFSYSVPASVTASQGTFTLLVKEATKENVDASGNLTFVNLVVQTTGATVSFTDSGAVGSVNLIDYIDKTKATYGEKISISPFFYNARAIKSGALTVTYDKTVFSFVSLTLSSDFTSEDLTDVNTAQAGFIYFSFALMNASSNFCNTFSVVLTPRQNVAATSAITAQADNLRDANNGLYSSNKPNDQVQVVYDPLLATSKGLSLTPVYDGKTPFAYQVKAHLDAGVGLGAGDFQLNFPVAELTYSTYKTLYAPSDSSYFNLYVNTTSLSQGILKFGLISTIDLSDALDLVSFTFVVNTLYVNTDVALILSGSGTTDSLAASLSLAYQGSTTTLLPNTHVWGQWTITKNVTFKTDGERQRVCEKCGAIETEVIDHATYDFSAMIAEFVAAVNAIDPTLNDLSKAFTQIKAALVLRTPLEGCEDATFVAASTELDSYVSLYNETIGKINTSDRLPVSPLNSATEAVIISVVSFAVLLTSSILIWGLRRRHV